MADPTSSAIQALKSPPLRHDPAAMARSSLDISPNRSSVQSSGVHTPSSSVPSTPVTSVRGISPEEKPLHYGNSNTFLTELAAHERRVLELKEELQKAEEELDRLKKQWASHEAAKRRNEVRHLEQLQPLKASLSGSEISRDTGLDPSTRELDRRKMLPPPIKPLQRTVFSGSRHARTLSLLSPKDFVQGSTSPSRGYGQLRHNRNTIDDTVKSTTTHELGTSTDGPNDPHTRHKDLPKDVILETGKQLVGDFRQGLWTFFEDLKQVTVGDEAASASDPRYQHCLPAGSLPKTQARRERWTTVKKNPTREGKSLSGDISARRQNTEPSPSPGRIHMRSVEQVRAPSKPPSILGGYYSPRNMNTNSSESDDNDGWDNWDTTTTSGSTPRRKELPPACNPMSSPLTDKSSPKTSTSSLDATSGTRRASDSSAKRDDIPWPALKTLSPERLRITASIVMSEWEKSLAPQVNTGAECQFESGLKEQKAE